MRRRKKIINVKAATTLSSTQRDVQSAMDAQQKAKEEQAKLSKKIADKTKNLSTKQASLTKKQAKDRENHQKELEKIQKEYIAIQAAQVKAHLNDINKPTFEEKEYDVFISHAFEDKKSFVEPLANALKEAGIKTWYDSDQIGWGQSIRQSIDMGLIKSKFCMIILSQNFLTKYWLITIS